MPPTERWPSSVTRPACLRFGEERLVELGVRQRERHVHPRARVLRDRIAIEATSRRSPRRASRALARLRSPMRGEAALALQPLEHQPRHVPGERRRRVQHRAVLRHRREVHERRRRRRARGRADRRARSRASGPPGRCSSARRRRSRRTSTRRSAATGSSRTCRRPAARRRRRARSETRRRRWSRSACSAGTRRPACSFQLATRRNRRVRLAGVGGDVDLRVVLRLADAPSSTTRRCSRSRRRCRASSRFSGTAANCAVAPPCRNSTL